MRAALRRELTTHLSKRGYTPFLDRISPRHFPGFNWHYDHVTQVRRALARVTRGDCKRLIVSMPPQFGKSSVLTVPYPVYRLVQDPRLRVAVGAYNQTHANRFSRKSRRIAQDVIPLSRERKAVNEWETAAGGYYVAVGKGAGITGLPVDLLIVDDPHKDAAEAMSATERENVWEWWTDSLFTRLSKGAAVVVIQTRWHTEDLAGRLHAQGGWESVVLQGVNEKGESLCPELHPIEQLEEARRNNPTSFEALYQQKPLDLSGGFFKGLEKLTIHPVAPTPDQFVKRVRFWDLASTEKQAGADPDYTAGVLMGKHKDGTFWVLDVIRERLGPAGVRGLIKQTAAADGIGVKIRIEREGGASGKLAADAIVREDLAGYSAMAVKPVGSKAERAEPWANQVEVGNARMVRNGHVNAFLAEHRSFPTGSHDDMCLVAGSLVLCDTGPVPIEEVTTGRMVMTRRGLRPVTWAGQTGATFDTMEIDAGNGSVVDCTRGHPIYVLGRGWTRAEDVKCGDEVLTCRASKRSSGTVWCGDGIPTRRAGTTACISSVTRSGRPRRYCCTAKSGRQFTATSPTGARYTTGTTTPLTTTSTIWSACPSPNIVPNTAAVAATPSAPTWGGSARVLASGTLPTMGASGTDGTPLEPSAPGRLCRWCVSSAGPLSSPVTLAPGSALPRAARSNAVPDWRLTRECVSSVPPRSRPTGHGAAFAPSRVRSVTAMRSAVPRPVYNLTVAGEHEFFANGVLVHNCDAASGAFKDLTLGGAFVIPV